MFRPVACPLRALIFTIFALLTLGVAASVAEPTQVPTAVSQVEPTPIDTPDISATVIAAIAATAEAQNE